MGVHERCYDTSNPDVAISDDPTGSGLCPDKLPRGLVTLRIVVLTWSISVCLLAMVRSQPTPRPSAPPMACMWVRRGSAVVPTAEACPGSHRATRMHASAASAALLHRWGLGGSGCAEHGICRHIHTRADSRPCLVNLLHQYRFLPAVQVYLLLGDPSSGPVNGLYRLPNGLERSLVTTVITRTLSALYRMRARRRCLPMLRCQCRSEVCRF